MLQEVEGITPGKVYQCDIYFNYLFVKQTTGYGYALEFDTPLTLPEFTKGATNLKSFCTTYSGEWMNLPDEYTGNGIVKSFLVNNPLEATSVYICLGTKGALAKYEVDSVKLAEVEATEVLFRVTDKQTLSPVPGAEIFVDGSDNPFIADTGGTRMIDLVPGEHQVEVVADWYAPFTNSIVVPDTSLEVEVLLDSVQKVKDVETRISKYGDNATPYPLFGHLWTEGLDYSDDMVDTLVATLDYIIGGSGVINSKAVSDRLHDADPRFQVIKYQGGWKTGRSAAEQIKMDLPYYRCGNLVSQISEEDTILVVKAPSDNKGLGLLASEEGNFITWLRIGDELMKIISVSSTSGYPITVEVERGLDQSAITSHGLNAAITAPLYSVPPVPGGNNSGLSYFATIYQVREPGLESNAIGYATNDHIDGIWIDILVGWLNAKNMTGGNYTLWDHVNNNVLTDGENIKRTKDAIQRIFTGCYSRLGYYPVIYGNNVLYSHDFNSSSRGYMMVDSELHKKVIDGFCHENSWGHMSDNSGNIDNDGEPIHTDDKYITVGENGHFLEWIIGDRWISNSKAITLLAQNNLPNQPMTINAGFKNQWFAADLTDQVRYDFNKYCYASYLLAVHMDEDSLISCRMGISPMVQKGNEVTRTISTLFLP